MNASRRGISLRPRGGEQRPVDPIDAHVWRVAAVVILGTIMSILDTTIVNVALNTLHRELHSSIADIQWVVTGYLLSLATVIPLTGWSARRFGARKVYLFSVALFTVGSGLCGLATSTGSLIAFRVLQGIGGGMILPVGQLIMARAAGPQRMGRVMSAMGVPAMLAPIFGPTLGGLIIDHLHWSWIFFVNIPIGIAAIVLALRLLPETESGEAGRLDVRGLVLLAVGMPAVTYGLAEIGVTGGFSSVKVMVPLLVGIALVGAFVPLARRAARPLLDVRLYANRVFASASAATFFLGAALFGSMILIPLYFQQVRGDSVVTTGLLVGPQGIGVAIAMVAAGRVVDRIGGGLLAITGVIITVLATVPLALTGAGTSILAIELTLAVRGFGIGMAFMPAFTVAYAALRPDQLSDATPQLNVLQRVGGSIGTAVLAVVLQRATLAAGHPLTAARAAGAFGTTYWWTLGITAGALIPCVMLLRAERPAVVREPVVAGAEVV